MTTPPAGVDFTPEAVEEARSAFVWYQERSELAARAFLSELDQAILRILEAPRTWPKYRSGTRRCLLERFPFSIVYRRSPRAHRDRGRGPRQAQTWLLAQALKRSAA